MASPLAWPGSAVHRLPSEKLVPNSIFGHGRVNALVAVNMALEIKTSVQEKLITETDKYNVFPNPCFESIFIVGKNKTEKAEVSVIDNFGKEFYKGKQIIDQEISVKDLPAGMYFVKINNGKSISINKVVKQ